MDGVELWKFPSMLSMCSGTLVPIVIDRPKCPRLRARDSSSERWPCSLVATGADPDCAASDSFNSRIAAHQSITSFSDASVSPNWKKIVQAPQRLRAMMPEYLLDTPALLNVGRPPWRHSTTGGRVESMHARARYLRRCRCHYA